MPKELLSVILRPTIVGLFFGFAYLSFSLLSKMLEAKDVDPALLPVLLRAIYVYMAFQLALAVLYCIAEWLIRRGKAIRLRKPT